MGNGDFVGPVVAVGGNENMTVIHLMLDDPLVLRDDGFYNRFLGGVKTRKAYFVTLLDDVASFVDIGYIHPQLFSCMSRTAESL